MKTKHITGTVVRAVDAPAGGPTIVIASTDQPDRMDDVVDQATWMLDEFRANPLILWSHERDDFPVGKCTDVGVVEGALRMAIEWDESTEDGATCARQFREGFLSAVSVGFRPGRAVPRSQLPKDDPRYKAGGYGMAYYDCTLYECSAVTVPANAGALVVQRAFDDGLEMARRAEQASRDALVEQLRAVIVVELARALDARQPAEEPPEPDPVADAWDDWR